MKIAYCYEFGKKDNISSFKHDMLFIIMFTLYKNQEPLVVEVARVKNLFQCNLYFTNGIRRVIRYNVWSVAGLNREG